MKKVRKKRILIHKGGFQYQFDTRMEPGVISIHQFDKEIKVALDIESFTFY